MHPVAERYRAILERLDRWFELTAQRHPGVIPCRAGCSACCHGPFDISVADTLLLREGIEGLSPAELDNVRQRATALLARIRELAPEWGPPYDIADLGEERFDRIVETLADAPCPLLDERGACLVYQSRPLVCRLIGLPMMTAEGEILENACPIQEQFPAYALLDPQLFDFGALQDAEAGFNEEAAEALFGSRSRAGFETTIAAVAADPDSIVHR
jgi:Fe-S-cluster containining protein